MFDVFRCIILLLCLNHLIQTSLGSFPGSLPVGPSHRLGILLGDSFTLKQRTQKQSYKISECIGIWPKVPQYRHLDENTERFLHLSVIQASCLLPVHSKCDVQPSCGGSSQGTCFIFKMNLKYICGWLLLFS